jgi:hypothetical protein
MANPQVGAVIQVRVPNNTIYPGQVHGNIVLGTPNMADVAYTGQSNQVVKPGFTQDDTLSADNTFKIIAGGV